MAIKITVHTYIVSKSYGMGFQIQENEYPDAELARRAFARLITEKINEQLNQMRNQEHLSDGSLPSDIEDKILFNPNGWKGRRDYLYGLSKKVTENLDSLIAFYKSIRRQGPVVTYRSLQEQGDQLRVCIFPQNVFVKISASEPKDPSSNQVVWHSKLDDDIDFPEPLDPSSLSMNNDFNFFST